VRTQLQHDAASSFWLRTLPLLLCGVALLVRLADALWSDSVDLAHHYALAARLAQHWLLPAAYDHSLGEMNVYPSGAHVLAALAGRLAGSTLLGLQLVATAAYIAVWAVLLLFLRQLPARAAVLSALTLLVLLLVNRHAQLLELHGTEIIENFFYAQLVAQAGALLAMLAALALERAGVPAWWRYLLLLSAMYLLCSVHLMPALELLAILGLSCALDLLPATARPRRRPAVTPRARLVAAAPAVLAPLIGALLLVRHPGYAVMRSLSTHDGGIQLLYLNSPLSLGLYAGAVLLLSLVMLYSWRQAPAGDAARQALGLKYIGLYGSACALMCVLQAIAVACHIGTDYAVKKYVYALHTALLLELCMLPALLLAWHRKYALYPTPARKLAWHQSALLLSPLLLAVTVLTPLSKRVPHADISALVRLERQLYAMRELLAEPAGHYTYAARLGVSPSYAYMFSLGVFGVPRDNNAGDLLGNSLPTDLAEVGHLLTGADLAVEQPYARCRQAGSPAGLALLDGACLQAAIHPPEQHIALTDKNQSMLCQLSGFSAPEQNGSWSSAKTATITCPVPQLADGKLATKVALSTQAFLESQPLQRLDLRVNGGAPASFRYDAATPVQQLELPLPAGQPKLTLTLSLPDARSPQALGLGPDQRELGVMVRFVSFH